MQRLRNEVADVKDLSLDKNASKLAAAEWGLEKRRKEEDITKIDFQGKGVPQWPHRHRQPTSIPTPRLRSVKKSLWIFSKHLKLLKDKCLVN